MIKCDNLDSMVQIINLKNNFIIKIKYLHNVILIKKNN